MAIFKIISTDDEFALALNRLEEIFDSKPGTSEGDEAELLALLIEKYEEEHFQVPDPDPKEAIKYKME